MSRIVIGSGTTDSDGLVTGEYTGSGKGVVKFVAYNKEHTLQSETYAVIDASYYDDATSDKSSNYFIARDNSITYANNKYNVSIGASYNWIDLRAGTDLLEQIKGQSVKFKLDVETSSYRLIKTFINGSSSQISTPIFSDGTLELTDTIPSDATSVNFRIQGTLNQQFSFKNFLVYLI